MLLISSKAVAPSFKFLTSCNYNISTSKYNCTFLQQICTSPISFCAFSLYIVFLPVQYQNSDNIFSVSLSIFVIFLTFNSLSKHSFYYKCCPCALYCYSYENLKTNKNFTYYAIYNHISKTHRRKGYY